MTALNSLWAAPVLLATEQLLLLQPSQAPRQLQVLRRRPLAPLPLALLALALLALLAQQVAKVLVGASADVDDTDTLLAPLSRRREISSVGGS